MKTVEEYRAIAQAEIARQLSAAEREFRKEKAENPDKYKKEKVFPPSVGLKAMVEAGQVALIFAVLEDVQALFDNNDAADVPKLIQEAIENLD
jgi:hypothetical protein